MEADWLQQLGPLGAMVAFAGYIIARDFNLFGLGSRRGGHTEDEAEVINMIKDLHKWHAKEDASGRKIWYSSNSLESAIDKLSRAIETNTAVLSKFVTKQEVQETKSRANEEKLNRILEKVS